MMGASALTIGAMFTSCGNDDVSATDYYQAVYEQKFVQVFGQPSANQDWGFSASGSTRATRAITVNGDTYDAFPFPSAEELNAAFPTAIPANADEVSQLETLYKGTTVQTQWGETTLWDIYAIYANKIVEGYNLKITQAGVTELGGNFQNSGYDQAAGKEIARPYNVYVDVDGDVTIRRVGATHFNLYILRGNVTLESNYGEQAGLISVAAGATLTDQRNSIAANQGVQVFNRGTINATNPEKYDIGNFCKVYNQGKFYVTGALTYSPGDANNSYFVNFSDEAELTASSMTLNSTGNFFNDGKVVIDGLTNVTQARLYWVNAGHYTTGTMTFSAKNTTFYNYCQLIVLGNAHMYDGEFNLMTNSYTEAGSAEFDNFFINMYGSTGMHVKGAVKLEAQGDGTFQGFKNKDAAANKYVLVDGKVTIASHKQTLNIESGITYSFNAMEIIKGGNVVTEEYLQSIGDGDYPVTVLQGTECPYGQLTVTPNTNSCGATWSTGTVPPPAGPTKKSIRIMAEDVSASDASDFDFNDVVFDVEASFPEGTESVNQVKITLWAAGGTLPLRINSVNGTGGFEVHNALGISDIKTMINTHAKDCAGTFKEKDANGVEKEVTYSWVDNAKNNSPYEETITLGNGASISKDNFEADVNENLRVEVEKVPGNWILLTAQRGRPACKIGCPVGTPWALEKHNMNNAFTTFKSWVNSGAPANWYSSKANAQIYNAGMSVIYGKFD